MLVKFDKLLKIIGIFKTEYYELDNNNCIVCFSRCIKFKCRYFYTVFIFSILLIEPILLINYILQTKTHYMLSSLMFSFITSLNYLLGFSYISNNHFHKIFLDIILNKYKINYCISKEKNLISSILITSLLFIIFNMVNIFKKLDNFHNYYLDINNTLINVFYIFHVIFYTLYSRLILSFNMHIFYLVFCKHLKDIKYQTRELEEVESWTNSQTKVAELCHNLIELRYELGISISKLGKFYIWLTILGSFGIGLAVHYKKYDTTIVSNIIIYFILQIIFLSIISIVGKTRQKLCDIIHTPAFSMKYIMRDIDVSETIDNVVTLDNNTIITIRDINKKNKNIDLDIINIEINDNINDNINENNENNEKKYNKMLKGIYNNVEQSGSSIDWIILNNILNNKWTSIDLFGISFDDGSGISKSLALTTTIVAMINYIFTIFN